MRYKIGVGTLGVIMTMFLVFGGFFICFFFDKTKEEITYVTPPPIHQKVEQVEIVEVYQQEIPIIPVKTVGKELVLIDKSKSMETFVTNIYTSNIKFFTNHDVWAFDTDTFFDVDVETINFGGNTNVFQAINLAAEKGYETIWLCSDLEHNTGEIVLSEYAKKINIIVYSPKNLSQDKTESIVEELKKCKTRIITIT